ncbi:50S rRNA methyltransferase, partial [Staphylococcus aureus]
PESRASDAATRISEEAAAIAALIPDRSVLVCLDERGQNIDSASLAAQIGRWRDEGGPAAGFGIGGAHGLSPELRRRAKLCAVIRA